MSRRGIVGWVLLAAVIVAAVALLWGMMRKRFSTGTTYPPLSTLRADPLGARAVFEALDRLPAITAERNFRQLKHLSGAPGKTLFLLNVSKTALHSSDAIDGSALSGFVVDGGRLVITLDPHSSSSFMKSLERAVEKIEKESEEEEAEDEDPKEESPTGTDEPAAKPATEDKSATPGAKAPSEDNTNASESSPENGSKDDADSEEEEAPRKHRPSLSRALKFDVERRDFVLTARGGARLKVHPRSPLSVLPMPAWYSNTSIIPLQDKSEGEMAGATLDPSWEPLAFRGNRVMIAQRRLGTGSVVVCTDTFFMSNQALWKDPAPEFLLWMTGGARTIIFDERHHGLGMGDDPGIMNLARRYHMHGLFVGGVVLFLLFVWRNSSTLIPHDEAADLGLGRSGIVSGEGASAGLTSLLRRGTPRSSLLSRCLDVWRSTKAASARIPAARVTSAQQMLASELETSSGKKDVVNLYQKLTRILHSKPPSS